MSSHRPLKSPSGTCSSPWLVLFLWAAVLVAGPETGRASSTEIQVKSLADGTPLIFNEGSTTKNLGNGSLRSLSSTSELGKWIWHYAGRQGIDPRLVQAVVQVESAYDPRAMSRRGAMGLMQLMPATAKELGVTNPYDLRQNLNGGTKYLRQQIDTFSGDLKLALAAYNAGPSAVSSFRGVPPYRETRDYVDKVMHLYRGNGPSVLVQEHLKETAARRQQARKEASPKRQGSKVYMIRDPKKGIVFTTSPPASR